MRLYSTFPVSLIRLRALVESECDDMLLLILNTYSNNFARRLCPVLSQSSSSSSCKHSRSSRAIAESSLFFNGVGVCPRVREYRDKLTDLHYLMKLQEGIKRRLDDKADRQYRERRQAGKPSQ